MKFLVVLAALAALAAATPQDDKDATIVSHTNNVGLDSYDFKYEQSNQQHHEEQGQLRNAGTENEAIAVTGTYKYVAPDGKTYTVTYTADENGYQAQGEHLPTRR